MGSSSIALPQRLIEVCKIYGKVVSFEPKEVIQHRGDNSIGLSVVLQGTVQIGNFGADGKYLTTRVSSIGETFGEFTLYSGLPRTHTAIALDSCKIIKLSQQEYQTAIAAEPELTVSLLALMSTKLHLALEMIEDIRRLPVIVRVAKLIRNLSKVENSDKIQLTQNEIADMVGVTVLATHKALKQLKEQNLISLKYGAIEITDMSLLSDWITERDFLTSV